MLKGDNSPDSESRLANIEELVNAAAEAAERGENAAEFLDHAALVADADSVDEQAPVSLLTIHNAKGLEFSNVFIAGLEEGLFPHSRSLNSEAAMEEERRLCYVGMTRAEKRLYMSWARYRRRFGGGQPEVCIPSRFLNEVPPSLREKLSVSNQPYGDEVDLFAEQHDVRQSVKRNLYTGRTVNSVDNIAQFFAERGMPLPSGFTQRPQAAKQTPPAPAPKKQAPATPKLSAPVRSGPARSGQVVHHPKYGRGTVLRREGDGEDAKLTISFPGYGLKKIVEKYAGIKVDE
jgi:DNA helicase-2/ATP-dependent DNA helicase PcrA